MPRRIPFLVFASLVMACASNPGAPAAPTPIATAKKPLPPPGPTIEWITIGPRDGAKVDVRYPHFGRPGGIDKTLDDAMRGSAELFIREVKKAQKHGEAGADWTVWHLTIRCAPTIDSATIASVRCMTEEHAGLAHPTLEANAFNALLDDAGTPITLEKMFLPKKDHATRISDLCVDALRQQKAQWIVDGMTDVRKFLHTVNVTKDGLLVTFNPYEVGPNAEGFHEVTIPWAPLREYIDSNGPVSSLGIAP